MAVPPELHDVFEKLGDINATLREVKHATNNNSQKIDTLAGIVASQGAMREMVDRITGRQEINEARIADLEADKHRREGAIGLVEWLCKHWPITLIFGALAVAVMWANGRLGI